MPHHLIAKLHQFTSLSDGDRVALHEVMARQRQIGAREDIVREGEAPGPVRVILDGWACRYKQMKDGSRQITACLLAGDLCDTHVNVLCEMDHSIGTLTPVTLAEIPRDQLDALVARHPRVGQALWWEMLAAASVQREWTVNIAQRAGVARLAHLLCELFHRLQAVGLTKGHGYGLPLSQMDLAEALGLTGVHVNRCLKALRVQGLIAIERRWLTIPDLPRLQRVALFSPNYLHLGCRDGPHMAIAVPASHMETGRHAASPRHSAR